MGTYINTLWGRITPFSKSNNFARYVLAAVLARMATGGSGVAVILLAHAYGAEGKVIGMLAACMTAPHVLGPIYGRWLDESRDPRIILIAASFMYVTFFQLAVLGFKWDMLWLIICSLLICGASTSFMMGGLSTQLAKLVNSDVSAQRRAQSYDTLTYGFGLTVGPMLLALISTTYSIELASGILMSLPFLAGITILSLPLSNTEAKKQQTTSLGYREILRVMHQSPSLRRTIAMTSSASFSVAVLPILAVYLSTMWQLSKENGAYLVTFYGLGCICGAVLLMFKPMKANAIVLLRNVGIALLVTLLLVAASPSFEIGLASYLLCGVVNSVFFAVTLAARREHAPKQGAAQVYMWVAAAKISAASLGTFIAGMLLAHSIALTMAVSVT